MEISNTECKRILRTLELKAYRSVVDALRAQGALTHSKHEVLKNLAAALKIGEDRYCSEMRRAANDDFLNTIARCMTGENTEAEWQTESMKKVPLTPMVASQTAFTALADVISDIVALENEKFSDSITLPDAMQSFKCRSDENLKKYHSSKVFDSLLQKRKNNHQDEIFSELEKIKFNSNYQFSPTKSNYIEISYDESSNVTPADNVNCSEKNISWKLDSKIRTRDSAKSPPRMVTFSSYEKTNGNSLSNSFVDHSDNIEITSDPLEKEKNDKLRVNLKKNEQINISEKKVASRRSKIQSIVKKNSRGKPSKKYSFNEDVESFENENAEDSLISKLIPTNNLKEDNNSEKDKSQNPKESRIEISYFENNINKSIKTRKTKRRSKKRSKFVRQSKITRVRKFTASPRMKSDTVKETSTKIARFSSRNARRRNYARMASGNYDLLDFENNTEEKKNKSVLVKKEEDVMKETDDDTFSDNSNAPIEVSYSNPAPPKNSNYDLESVSNYYTDDEMRPHTFNLIPASRRLKLLKKRASSPSGEEVPSKQILLDVQSKNEQSTISQDASSLLNIETLQNVIPIHDKAGTGFSHSLNKFAENSDSKLTPNLCNDLASSSSLRDNAVVEEKSSSVSILPRVSAERKIQKPKIKLSETSTIENLHSLLSKVKEGDLKKVIKEFSNNKKQPTRKNTDHKTSPQFGYSIESNPKESLIEVGSDDSWSLNGENYDVSSKSSDSEDQILIQKDDEISSECKQSNDESDNLSTNEEVVSITLDEFEDPLECDASEQLIDIESADIIIGDGSDLIVNQNNQTVETTELSNKGDGKSPKKIQLSMFSSTAVQNNEPVEPKKDETMITNIDKKEPAGLLDSFALKGVDSKNVLVKSSVLVKPQSVAKNVLPASSDFRYIADADDPCVKNAPTLFSLLQTSSPEFIKSADIVTLQNDHSLKITKPTFARNADEINNPAASNSPTPSKDQQFVLLETTSVTGSKSLLKSLKPFSKTTISNKTADSANSNFQKPKKLAIYSSLKNINLASISSFSSNATLATTNVTSQMKCNDNLLNSNRKNNHGEIVVSQSTSGMDSKRLVFSQALKNSLKSIEPPMNQFDGMLVKISEDVALPENFNKMIEISSNDSQKDRVIPSSDVSEDNSSTKLSELKTFFSKNIIKKQS